MCLAVPGKVLACRGDEAVVDLQGNRLKVCTVLTPRVGPGDWVLVHAGFAITQIEEQQALETWDYLKTAYTDELGELRSLDVQNASSPRDRTP